MDSKKKRLQSRRKFIHQIGVVGSGLFAGATLSGCSTVDHFFGIEKKTFDNEVIIFGGGAAGLSAAFELKRLGKPYRIFEASENIGGRVKTIRHFNSDHQTVELGAEYISSHQLFTRNLCQELKLKLVQVPNSKLPSQLVHLKEQVITSPQWQSQIQKFAQQIIRARFESIGDYDGPYLLSQKEKFPQAVIKDRRPLDELFLEYGKDLGPDSIKLLKTGILSQYGKPTEEISAFDFLRSLHPEQIEQASRYKVSGGNSLITQTLYDRVAGVIPEYLVKTSSALVQIKRQGKYLQCWVQDKNGIYTVQAKKVILAVPLSQLKKISGLAEILNDPQMLSAIQSVEMGKHFKFALGFKQRFWQKDSERPWQGGVFGNMKSQVGWDSSQGQEGNSGALTFQVGGVADFDFQQTALTELSVFHKDFRLNYDGQSAAIDWGTKKWIEGSITSYQPGQFFDFNGCFDGLKAQGQIAIAGEHTFNQELGTLNGALHSGALAARALIQN